MPLTRIARFIIAATALTATLRGESFETAPAGPMRTWRGDVGEWSAAEGHARIHGGKGHSGAQSLRLMGDGGRELVLKLARPAVEGATLGFRVERWTAREPFSFRIDARTGGEWVEVLRADKEVKVGGFHHEVRLKLAAGVSELRFRCTAHADGGVLIDDVRLQSPGPLRAVAVETVQPVCPAFIREDFNPVLGFRIDVEGSDGEALLEAVELGFDGTTRLQDIASFRVVAGGADPAAAPGREVGSGTSAAGRIKLAVRQPLAAGENWFWISPELKPAASVDGRVDAAVFRVKVAGTVLEPREASPTGAQRIGYAVRLPGDDGSKSYRIPGLARTKAGTLIAVYDIRWKHAGDLPADIDVGVSRSTDGGQSWEPMRVAMNMGNDPRHQYDGVGDPAVLADPNSGRVWIAALWSHGKRAWGGSGPGLAPEETGQFMVAHSDDDGLTWSQPRNLTPQIKDPAWRLFFNGPGAGIVLRDGTLVFAAQYRAADGKPWSTMIASRDGGETWTVGSGVKSDTTEAQVAELADGSIMINCRDNRGGARTVAVTRDLGKSWRLHATDRSALREPVCMAGLLAWQHPRHGGTLWFSNPDSTRVRHMMTVKLSTDQGMTWPEKHHRLYDSRKCYGYSCLAPVGDTHIGVLYEGIDTMYFLRLPLTEWLD